MKNFVLGLMLVLTLTSMAQETTVKSDSDTSKEKSCKYSDGDIQTLFSSDASYGAYLGLNFNRGKLNGSEAMFIGGRIGWVMDHKLAMGFSGVGFVNTTNLDQLVDGNEFSKVQ